MSDRIRFTPTDPASDLEPVVVDLSDPAAGLMQRDPAWDRGELVKDDDPDGVRDDS